MALSGVPEPRDERLARAPLSLVVCQVRHERNLTLGDPKQVLKIVQRLGGDDWQVEERPTQDFQVQAGARGVRAAGTTLPAWRLTSKDERWVVAMQTDFFSLETASYTRWRDFREHFVRLVSAIAAEELSPAFENRIGVRFVNEIRGVDDVNRPEDWRGWIDNRFLGPVLHESLAGVVDQVRQALELTDHDGFKALVQHGAHTDDGGENSYRLDIDCYHQRGRVFEPDAVVEAAEQLHILEKQIFKLAITDKLYDHLKGEGSP